MEEINKLPLTKQFVVLITAISCFMTIGITFVIIFLGSTFGGDTFGSFIYSLQFIALSVIFAIAIYFYTDYQKPVSLGLLGIYSYLFYVQLMEKINEYIFLTTDPYVQEIIEIDGLSFWIEQALFFIPIPLILLSTILVIIYNLIRGSNENTSNTTNPN